MPRPRKFDDALRAKVLRAVMDGATLEEAAHAVTCTSRTIRREANREAAFAASLTSARRLGALSRRRRRVDDAAEDDWQLDELAATLAATLRQAWADKTPSPSERAA